MVISFAANSPEYSFRTNPCTVIMVKNNCLLVFVCSLNNSILRLNSLAYALSMTNFLENFFEFFYLIFTAYYFVFHYMISFSGLKFHFYPTE